MEAKVKVSVLGFSFNQARSGTYGLVLSEEMGPRRLMVVVGVSEAQSIAFELQQTAPPRPLTHDLIRTILHEFDIKLLEALIYKYEDGVYFSKLFLRQESDIIEIESRTSDAIAIALRTKSPIYTTESILRQQGIVFDDKERAEKEYNDKEEFNFPPDYSVLSKEELESLLKDAIEGEDYELASVLRDEIRKKSE